VWHLHTKYTYKSSASTDIGEKLRIVHAFIQKPNLK